MAKNFLGILKKVACSLALLGACSLLSCDESLPPRDLKDFLVPVFRASETGDVFFRVVDGDTILTGAIAVSLGLKNNSDEYLQAKANINGRLEITSPSDPTFHRAFNFTVPKFGEVTINPLSEFTVSVEWDQRDDSCKYIFRDLEFVPVEIGRAPYYRGFPPLTFRVKGKLQLWPNVQTKDLPEISFSRQYYCSFKPDASFLNSRSCRQFRSFL